MSHTKPTRKDTAGSHESVNDPLNSVLQVFISLIELRGAAAVAQEAGGAGPAAGAGAGAGAKLIENERVRGGYYSAFQDCQFAFAAAAAVNVI